MTKKVQKPLTFEKKKSMLNLLEKPRNRKSSRLKQTQRVSWGGIGALGRAVNGPGRAI